MFWTANDIPDLTGRVAVVTGANGGLWFQTALALAGAGAEVWMAARNPDKLAGAQDQIRNRHPVAGLHPVVLNLGDLASVRAAAEEILGRHQTIDLLVNNAGLMAMPERRTADGFEMQFGVRARDRHHPGRRVDGGDTAGMTSRRSRDRAGAVRAAFAALVADHGFHGASMGAVAQLTGVATGTAYVHYSSKEELLYATYLKVKRALGLAASALVDPPLAAVAAPDMVELLRPLPPLVLHD